jgi:hypothetical protein
MVNAQSSILKRKRGEASLTISSNRRLAEAM